jgi:O-glycosyl hydrolase
MRHHLISRHARPSGRAIAGACALALAAATGAVSLGSADAVATAGSGTAAAASEAGYAMAAAPTVVVQGHATYQKIAGFGASEAFGAANSIRFAPAKIQVKILSLLFGTVSGAGLTIMRNEISADPGSTIEPAAPASPEAAPAYLPLSSIGDDQGQLWLAQTIKKDFHVTDIYADAWSAPAFMKTNDAVANGGTLCGVPGAACGGADWRQAYASYLKQYAADYAAAGVPLTYVGPENEATFAPDYDSMVMTPAQTASFLEYLGPTMASSGLPTKTECCASIGWPEARQFAAAIAADPKALKYTALFTSHGYAGAPDTPLADWPKPAWETEWSTFEKWDPSWDDGTDASGFSWARHIYAGLTSANLSAFLYWWGTGNGSDNESLLRLSGTSLTTSARLWAFAGYSRLVRPGAVRVKAANTNKNLEVSTFHNANGSIVIVVLNTAKSAQGASFSVTGVSHLAGTVTPYLTNATNHMQKQQARSARGSFGMKIPARSLVTFYLPAHS